MDIIQPNNELLGNENVRMFLNCISQMTNPLQIQSLFQKWNAEWQQKQPEHGMKPEVKYEEEEDSNDNFMNDEKINIAEITKTEYENIASILNEHLPRFTLTANTTVDEIVRYFQQYFGQEIELQDVNGNINERDDHYTENIGTIVNIESLLTKQVFV